MHGVDILFDGVGHRASRGRLALVAGELAGEIMRELLDAFQSCSQRAPSLARSAHGAKSVSEVTRPGRYGF